MLVSHAEDTTACSHEEEMRERERERSDSKGGCRGAKCDRLTVSVGGGSVWMKTGSACVYVSDRQIALHVNISTYNKAVTL